MKRVTVLDNAAGHAVGWDPDGAKTTFLIFDQDVSGQFTAFINTQAQSGSSTDRPCAPLLQLTGNFDISCSSASPEGSVLHYVVENLPSHIVQ